MLQVSRFSNQSGILYQGKYDKNTPSGEAAFKLWNFAVNAAPKAGVVSKDIYSRLSTTPGPGSRNGLQTNTRKMSSLSPKSASNATTTNGTSLLPTTNGRLKPVDLSLPTTGRSTEALSSRANPSRKNGKLSSLHQSLPPTSLV